MNFSIFEDDCFTDLFIDKYMNDNIVPLDFMKILNRFINCFSMDSSSSKELDMSWLID